MLAKMPCSIEVEIVPLEVFPSFPPIDLFVPETFRACFQINLNLACVEQHSVTFNPYLIVDLDSLYAPTAALHSSLGPGISMFNVQCSILQIVNVIRTKDD